MFEVRVYSGDEGWSEIMRSEGYDTEADAKERMRGIPQGYGYYLVVQEATAPPLPGWLAEGGCAALLPNLTIKEQRDRRAHEEYIRNIGTHRFAEQQQQQQRQEEKMIGRV